MTIKQKFDGGGHRDPVIGDLHNTTQDGGVVR